MEWSIHVKALITFQKYLLFLRLFFDCFVLFCLFVFVVFYEKNFYIVANDNDKMASC